MCTTVFVSKDSPGLLNPSCACQSQTKHHAELLCCKKSLQPQAQLRHAADSSSLGFPHQLLAWICRKATNPCPSKHNSPNNIPNLPSLLPSRDIWVCPDQRGGYRKIWRLRFHLALNWDERLKGSLVISVLLKSTVGFEGWRLVLYGIVSNLWILRALWEKKCNSSHLHRKIPFHSTPCVTAFRNYWN